MNRKTHLIAIAALASLSTAASAQSNVTLFGLVDVMAGRFGGSVTGVNARDAAISRVEDGGLSTSQFGFKGNEDLGSGVSAVFELSGFLRADTGEQGRSNALGAPINVAADPMFSRSAWVGLNSKTLGRVRLGNITSLMYVNSLSSNAFGDSMTFSPINLVTFVGGPLSGGTSWTNQVVYDSPDFAGLTVSGAVAAGEGQGGRNAAARARYVRGPLAVALVYQDVKKNPLTFADGTSPNNTKSWQFSAVYDFGIAKLFGHGGQIKNDGTESAPLDVTYDIWDLSAAVPVGSGNVLMGYASRKTCDAVGPVPATAAAGNKERQVVTIGYDHVLSKRTDIYALALNDRTVTNTLPGPPRLVSASGNNFAIGVRHRF